METASLTIHCNKNINTLIPMAHLRDIERRLLSTMISSKDFFLKIHSSIKTEDFTFVFHQIIFENICLEKEDFIEVIEKKDAAKLDEYIDKFSEALSHSVPIEPSNVYSVLHSEQSENLKLDICELKNFAEQRDNDIAFSSDDTTQVEILFDERYGLTKAYYKNNRLYKISTTNSLKLPAELCDTFGMTMEKSLECLNVDNSITMESDEPEDGIVRINVTKNNSDMEIVEKLRSWSNRYSIQRRYFPFLRHTLYMRKVIVLTSKNIEYIPNEFSFFNHLIMLVLNDNKITELPDAIFGLRSLWHLSVKDNRLNSLSSAIGDLKQLKDLSLCNNHLKNLPESLYSLKELIFLCLHGNKIEEVSDKISQLSQLEILSLSNTPLKALPKCIAKLRNLRTLYVENTFIESIPEEILALPYLRELQCDDKHLPFIVKNKHLLHNMNTVILSESHYEANSPLVEELGLDIETHEKWMDDKDRQEHGCIMLKQLIN